MKERIKRVYNHPWVEFGIRWVLGVSFMFASYHKIVDPESFARAIYSYDLFPEFTINVMAAILPYLELISGLALILGAYYRGAAALIGWMLIAFIISVSINLIRGHEFDCGCFSVGKSSLEEFVELYLLRDAVLWCFALYVLFFSGKRKWCIQKIG